MKRLVLIGGGGFSKEVAEVAERLGYEVVGCVDDAPTVRLNYPHWGEIRVLNARRSDFDEVILAIGAVDRKSLEVRARIASVLEKQGYVFARLISPSATIAAGVKVGDGVFVAHGVVVSVDAELGKHVVLNSNSVVGHDSIIGELSVIAPFAFVGGDVRLGQQVLVGPGAQIMQGLTVGYQTIVSVASVVFRSLPALSTTIPLRSRVLLPKS